MRGFNSKADSLKAICNSMNVDLLTINETQLRGNKKVVIPGFKSYCRNRVNTDGGGIATCVKDVLVKETLQIFEGNDDNEIIITRHSQFEFVINVINVYGCQESRAGADRINENWDILIDEVRKIEKKGEFVCIIGDFNRKIGNLVPGNKNAKESLGGSLIRQFIESGRYCLLNSSDKVIGGPFTRYDPANPSDESKRSVLDLCLVSVELFKYVEVLVIDSKLAFTPARPIKNGLLYSDHYSLLLKLKNLPMKSHKLKSTQKTVRWNTNKEGGWKMYTELTENSTKLLDVALDSHDDPDFLMKSVEKELKTISYKSFGKVKEKSSRKAANKIDVLQVQKNDIYRNKEKYNDGEFAIAVKNINDELSAALLTNQRTCLENELTLLKSIKVNKGKSAAIFKLKDDILGTKKSEQEAASLIHFKTGVELTNAKDIKAASLQYCVELLSNREPREGFKADFELKELVHTARMGEVIPEDVNNLTDFMFDQTYKALSKKTGKYDFLIRGGSALKSALLKVCQSVWATEKIPDSWNETTLIQLYKGKGPRNNLENMRHIHLKNEFSKFFGHLVVTAVKPMIFGNLSKFQIATKPGHSF